MKNDVLSYFLMGMIFFSGISILGGIRALEPVRAGDELELFVNVNNPTDGDFDDMSVKAIFFELGEYVISNSFDLDDGETKSARLYLNIPLDAPKGDHLVKIVVSNDDVYDSKFIYVNVI